MSLRTWLTRPRMASGRRWLYHIHLYTGLATGLLMTVVGLSGSALVFRPEIDRLLTPRPQVAAAAVQASLDVARDTALEVYPQAVVTAIRLPESETGALEVTMRHPDEHRTYVYLDPVNGAALAVRDRNRALRWLQELHFNLLGGTTGLMVNGVAAALLVAMCFTGLAVWWPGLRHWRRGFQVNRRATWKGLTYDLHRVVGIASLVLLGMFGVTGVYFAFPDAFRAALATIARDDGLPPVPVGRPAPSSGRTAAPTLDEAAATAARLWPEGAITFVYPPLAPAEAIRVRLRLPGEFADSGRSYVYVDAHDGRVLRADDARQFPLSARVIAWFGPLHFGTIGNLGGRPGNIIVRTIWLVAGLVPGTLFVTGFLVWWNRVMVKKRRHEEAGGRVPVSVVYGSVLR